MKNRLLSRRGFASLAASAGLVSLAGPVLAREEIDEITGPEAGRTTAKWRISGLQARDRGEYFPSSRGGNAILVVIDDRVLHYWGADGFYRIYPTSVPLSEEMTRRGRTEIVMKRPAPEWRPTPSMLRRNPNLPSYVGPGPDNPLGIRAMNLGWQYYLIHGTNDIRKIGRQASSGCIGMFNEHVVEIYDRTEIGTQVLVI